jgi:hypothetical protein
VACGVGIGVAAIGTPVSVAAGEATAGGEGVGAGDALGDACISAMASANETINSPSLDSD